MFIQAFALIILGMVACLFLFLIGQVGLLVLRLMKEMLHLKIKIGLDKKNP